MSETLNHRKSQMYRPLKRGGKIEVGIYRFGFNGQEKDDEIAEESTAVNELTKDSGGQATVQTKKRFFKTNIKK